MIRTTTIALASLLLVPAAVHAQGDLDIWVGDVAWSAGRVAITGLVNISNRPGYDNQPAFFPDQRTLVYAMFANGRAAAVVHDLVTGTARPLPEAWGLSPTPTADGRHFLLNSGGSVARFDLTGRRVQQLTDSVRVGYFAHVRDDTFALFINDPERRIVIYDVRTRAMETLSRGAVSPLVKVPGENAYTFAAAVPFSSDPAVAATIDPATVRLELRKLDLDRRGVERLAEIPRQSSGNHSWTPRNTVLLASGNTVYEWSPAAPDTWAPVVAFTEPGLQHLTRLVVSPHGERIALVSSPSDETLIRNARQASNVAIEAHAVAGIVASMEDSVVITRGSGARLAGKAEVTRSFTDAFAQTGDLVYVRTPERVELSGSNPLAAEHGTWVGRWTTPDGKAASAHGTYLVMWRNTVDVADGTPNWRSLSELYVTLGCTNCR